MALHSLYGLTRSQHPEVGMAKKKRKSPVRKKKKKSRALTRSTTRHGKTRSPRKRRPRTLGNKVKGAYQVVMEFGRTEATALLDSEMARWHAPVGHAPYSKLRDNVRAKPARAKAAKL